MEDYPDAESRLSPDADIVHHSALGSGIVKIIERNFSMMTRDELASTACLRIEAGTTDTPTVANELSMVERASKRVKIENSTSAYMDCRFIVPTSNMCERIFSTAGFALNSRLGITGSE